MKIGVIGLGLIGGSIFKDLTSLGYNVIGISKSQNGDNIYKTYENLTSCEVVFVCTPINKTLDVLDELEKILSPETIVTDVCSLKEFVSQKTRSYKFIPSHPMAGTEKQGFENSFEGMFKGANWVICPITKDENVEKLEKIIKSLGANPIIADAKEHDKAVAFISHMPMLLSQAIFKTASQNPLALKIAASGFRDMTRLAMSNIEMANDMIVMNAENIENSLLNLYKSIGELTHSNYKEQILKIKNEREKMY